MNDSIIKCIKKYAVETPNKLAIVDLETEYTYREYWSKITQVASFLKSIGCKKDEHIIIKNTQNIQFMVLLHAIQLINGIVVPIEKSANTGRITSLLNETNSTKFFGEEDLPDYECYKIEDAFSYNGSEFEFEFPTSEQTSMVLFTTGTTGKSKGVMIQHKAEYAVGINLKDSVEMKIDNVELLPMPINHAFSLRRYFANIVNGSTVIILDGVFFIQRVFELIEKYQVTAMALAPAALSIIFQLSQNKLGEYADQFDYLQFGTAPISETDKSRLIELLPNVRLYNIYASTEMGCVCVLNFNSADNRPCCLGYPSPGTKFRMVNDEGGELKTTSLESPGRITYTGTMLMLGYYNEIELTNKTLVNGYVQTSDLGYLDEAGRIYLLGRADDVITTGGNKVSPLEVEEIAKHYKGILDCICKGKPDKRLGAVPILYIVIENEINIKDLGDYLADKLEDFKRPRSIKIINEVPRTYNGKVDRKVEVI